jgi:foldase protein PrsA
MAAVLLSVLLALLVLASGVLSAGCGKGGGEPTGSPPPSATAGVVATVNGRPVHQSQVDAIMAEARIGGQDIGEKKAVEAAIDEELLRQEADRLGITVTRQSVDARVKALEKTLGGAAALNAALAGVSLTRAQLRERLAAVELGERVAIAKFPDIAVSRQRSKAFYRRNLSLFTRPAEVKLGDIIAKTERLARGAIAKIEGGQSFFATARQFSRDPELKDAGGQLGWLDLASLPEPIARAVAGMGPGDVSASPVTFNGFHVLKVYGRRPESTTPFAKVDRRIRAELVAKARDAALKRWLKEARSGARVEVAP